MTADTAHATRPPRRRQPFAGAVLAGAVLVSACGDDDATTGADTDTADMRR